MMTREAAVHYDPQTKTLACQGEWNLASLPELQARLHKIVWPDQQEIIIDGHAVELMDSSGAWLLSVWQNKLKQRGYSIRLQQFSEAHQALLTLVEKKLAEGTALPQKKSLTRLAELGRIALLQLEDSLIYLHFIGKLTFESLRVIRRPKHIRWSALASVIYTTGYQALPIIALLSFMIGVVITYQMGLQLRNYGANIYIVDLLGLSVLREFGPLLTSIMVAGRTGSAFTAQLGMMKINQEIDALDTMGVTPAELLLLPRIIGLFIALPLLTIWSDIFGVLGGMVMSNNMLNITWHDFLHRFPHVIPLKSLMIGLGKAPVFALIISSIACFQGMQVKGSADSVGRNTTSSVVLSIFFIMVADALFSIIFSKLKL